MRRIQLELRACRNRKYRLINLFVWTRKKQQSIVWVVECEPNPTKVVREKSTSKQMVACLLGKTGHVATVPVEQRRTEVRKMKKRTRIIACHGNASSHTWAQVSACFTGQNIELMDHPPHIKEQMHGKWFSPNTIFRKINVFKSFDTTKSTYLLFTLEGHEKFIKTNTFSASN